MSSVNELNKTLNQHMIEQAERSTKTETHQKHLFTAMTQLSTAMSTALETNTRLEEKITSLESRALDKLILVEDSVNEISERLTIQEKQIQMLEIINANQQGYAKGTTTQKTNTDRSTTKSITLVIAMLSVLVAAIGLIYKGLAP